MKLNGDTIRDTLRHLIAQALGHQPKSHHSDNEAPLRAELFSAEQMERHGKTLAGLHRLSTRHAPNQLLHRLADNEHALLEACSLLTTAVKANRRISPAGEWLLDNFYLIEEQIRTAKRHFPAGYSRELPRLALGLSAGLPRVYDIALEAISHGDGRVDPDNLSHFITAYQTISPLKLGELWAIPIMLRLALVENLRRVGARVAASTIDRDRADTWADQMMEVAEKDPKSLILVVADMARSHPPMASSFVAELARRLQGQSAALALPLTWIEQRLSESGFTIEQLVQSETQNQASGQVSISNSIGSLRSLGAMDWRSFVETMSGVERTLREDPAGIYEKMDFATRDRYRHAVEKAAKASHNSEIEVARTAIELARAGRSSEDSPARQADDTRLAHVGYYLVDDGLQQLRRETSTRFVLSDAIQRLYSQWPLSFYLGAIGLLTALFGSALLARAQATEMHAWIAVLVAMLLFFCSSHLAITLVNWAATLFVAPRPLPRLDFSEGIAPDCRTLVVVPTMLTSPQNIDGLVEALEVRFLANQDRNLLFGLLTDFRDAQSEILPDDSMLLLQAQNQIDALNEKYRNPQDQTVGRFFLFHRPRRWNPQDQLWMGYERKRGKLTELNALLRGHGQDYFSSVIGDTTLLPSVKYVITLDTDTQLPRDTARQFVGAMAHPLNRAYFDEASHRVTEGYGILQPRMAASLPGANRSRYARLFGSEPGIDPYTRVVSDVYQDLFGEGSFIGKGIYDVDAFEQALKGRLPENRILSHDLLEGCYARAALLSDVQLYEEYPARYDADVRRRHRWIRGDWQIASWLLSRVPGATIRNAHAGGLSNPLSALSQWKILDNLRRSLVAPALMLLLLLGWTRLPAAGFWSLTVIGIMLIPVFMGSLLDLFRKADDTPAGQHFFTVIRAAGSQCSQALFNLACLPYEAYFSLDAILRTNWRILATKKRLMEWMPSDNAAPETDDSLIASYRAMWIAPAIAVAITGYLALSTPITLTVAAPILLLWIAAPAIAWWISRPLIRVALPLTGEQIIFLRKISRKTWAFFETFVGKDDHWLPPDNYQEHPVVKIAHRTSPTNIGLSLLANLTAHDFGYIPTGVLIQRTASTLETMATLDRHRGHFYNWYDTQSLQPLAPLYISSVDSGNLAGHLLTLRAGLLSLPEQPILGPRVFDGLADTLGSLTDSAPDLAPAALAALGQLQHDLQSACQARHRTLGEAYIGLCRLTKAAEAFSATLIAFHGNEPEGLATLDAHWWADAFTRQCLNARDELVALAPWLEPSPISSKFNNLLIINNNITLRELSACNRQWLIAIEQLRISDTLPATAAELDLLQQRIDAATRVAQQHLSTIDLLIQQASDLAVMEYGFLYDETRHLLAIGFNVSEHRRDTSYYDLLASEARLCTFVAIAQGQLPQESWFALGRQITPTGGKPTLLSWSGSMFEYLMPLLVMPTYENTLLDCTYRSAVERQIVYGYERGVAWGISECGYNTFDAALNYQYRAFGVPGLGLKRGLAEDLVIAPYASALALMVAPEFACMNLQRLATEGMTGPYGFYEAADYTVSRLPRGQSRAVIRSFMAHHQGMIFLSLSYLILNRPMQRRFDSEPMFRATNLLLQERIPKLGTLQLHRTELSGMRSETGEEGMPTRLFKTPDTPQPEVQLLSNGRYHVMISNAGGGYSRWKDLAVTRWREDTTCDNWGAFCYIRDLANGAFWSNTHQPTLKRAQGYEAIFSEGRAEFRRRDHEYDTHTEIVVSPEDDIELRRVHITNRARTARTIEITSYAEVVLAIPAADALHPAFSNLFVQTEIVPERHAILCTRRPRSVDEPAPWMFHLMAVRGAVLGETSYETDRARFVGRGRTTAAPLAMDTATPLSGSAGSVLDPIIAIRRRITLNADQEIVIDMVTGIGSTRDAALEAVAKYQDRHLADRVFELAWTHSQVVLRQINANEADAQVYGRLASSIVYPNAGLRANAAVLTRNRRGQSSLWGYAISGDLPIVLLQIGDAANIDMVRQMVQAHAYWRLKGLAVDLVIWNEDRAGYRQLLQEQIMGLIAAGVEAHVIDRPGGIFVRRAEQISDEDRVLVQAVARAIISDQRGTLADQINRRGLLEVRAPHLNLPRFKPTRTPRAPSHEPALPVPADLRFANGVGGFTADGLEYVITTNPRQLTPAPWSNVLANAKFGTVISESGVGYTWSENAHEYRLTPWGNDPVSDTSGEAFYIRDEESGHFWSPAPLPTRGETPYVTRHGFGYSSFEHAEGGIHSELTLFVALDAPIKFSVLKLRNNSGRACRLTATGYVEWVLGDLRSKTSMHVITDIDPVGGALHARNAYNSEFPRQVAFFDVNDSTRTYSGDRTEFVGRNGTLQNPAAMTCAKLSNKVGAGLDPCAALQVAISLADGEEREIVFLLGAGRTLDEARQLVQRHQGSAAAQDELKKVRHYWQHTLGAVQVETPDPSLNLLANGWLVYQTLACRVWGRSGYYQSGGAFGFRDQLQDVMALVHTQPGVVREHLLRCAAHQFREGDVQHWWHPTSDRGVRTHCSDDYLWLPLAVSRYVLCTGDTGILDESIHFIEGRAVNKDEDSYYDVPSQSDETAPLYEHGVRAILRALRFGEHGLPLMGTGDWNDGMNLVGAQGKGESIWLAFFMYDVLMKYAAIARMRGDTIFAERCQSEATQLRQNVERSGWDGEWYRRAYFDDGTPLGSASNAECRIDAIAQSWAVLSGAGDPARSRTAMAAVDEHLVRREHGLIQLLDPPFDKSPMNPGYIKGYVPGVRENGGQYTHAAIWTVMAFAALGDHRRAWPLLDMINPINHANTAARAATYKVEPYVVAADIYAVAPHTGRGGWTWYTGSAGWMYRLITESLLGLRREGNTLRFAPCLPPEWQSFKLHYRYQETIYHIAVSQTHADVSTQQVTVDGVLQSEAAITLIDDRLEHGVEVQIQRTRD